MTSFNDIEFNKIDLPFISGINDKKGIRLFYKNNNIHDSILELYVPNDYPFKPYRVKQAVINEKIIQNYLKYLSNLSVGIKKYNKDILYYYVLIYNKIKPQILSAECMCCESITCSTKWSPSRTFIDFIDEYIEILGINIVLKYNIENIWNKTRLSILNEDVLNIILNNSHIECHTCKVQFNFKKNFYKKQANFYYCSKICYEFN